MTSDGHVWQNFLEQSWPPTTLEIQVNPNKNFVKSQEKREIEIIFENYVKLTKCISKLVFSTVFKYFEVLRMIVFLPFFVFNTRIFKTASIFLCPSCDNGKTVPANIKKGGSSNNIYAIILDQIYFYEQQNQINIS